MIDKQLKAMMDKKGLTLEKLSMLWNVPIETNRKRMKNSFYLRIVKVESMERNLYAQSQKLKRSGRQE